MVIQRRRFLMLAAYYFEWKLMGKQKSKNVIKPVGSKAMHMARIYWINNGAAELTILTCEPGECIRHIHDRMPVEGTAGFVKYVRYYDASNIGNRSNLLVVEKAEIAFEIGINTKKIHKSAKIAKESVDKTKNAWYSNAILKWQKKSMPHGSQSIA